MEAETTRPTNVAFRGWLSLIRAAAPWLALFLLPCAIYSQALHHGFVWDDRSILTANPLVADPHGLGLIWFSTQSIDYFPLTFTSFWLESRLWGMDPLGYHAINILLHALSCLLIWRILRRLSIPGAWLAALLFAVHPINVATVAWVAERKNTLSMLLYLGALYAFLRFLEAPRSRFYLLSVVLFVLALLAKSSVVMFPAVLLLLIWWRKGRVTWRDITHLLPFFSLSLLAGLATIWFQHHRAIDGALIPMGGPLSRLATATWAFGFYLQSIVFPFHLSMLYPHWQIGLWPLALWPAVPLLILVSPFRRALLFGLGYFGLSLLPILGLVPMYYFRLSPVADHWTYLAAIGVLALLAAGLMSFLPRQLAHTTAILLVALLSFLTWQRTQILSSEETLWTDVLRQDPSSWTATTNLALQALKQGDTLRAEQLARKAITLEPTYVEGFLNLGAILGTSGHLSEAISAYQEALRLRPDSPEVSFALASALAKDGQTGQALATYQAGLQLDPASFQGHLELGSLYYQLGDQPSAVREFQLTVKLDPSSADAHNNLAGAFYLSGDLSGAIREYRQALRYKPNHESARQNLEHIISNIHDSTDRILK